MTTRDAVRLIDPMAEFVPRQAAYFIGARNPGQVRGRYLETQVCMSEEIAWEIAYEHAARMANAAAGS